uniref:Uncharacterized protein n=1 Tax=Anguilla anguilla TaxID=7936 RepID=A0A0E9UST0_ANGAN
MCPSFLYGYSAVIGSPLHGHIGDWLKCKRHDNDQSTNDQCHMFLWWAV